MDRKQRKLVLMKNLPGCSIGRIFKEDVNGDFFHSMTDTEAISGNFKIYKFTKEEIANNHGWFEEIKNTESI